jgi:hypothetical protein
MLTVIFRRSAVVDEFIRRLGDDGVAVVVQPVDERPCRGILLILEHCGEVKRPEQAISLVEFGKQAPVVDVKPQRLGGRVQIGAVDEHGGRLRVVGNDIQRIDPDQ